MKRIKSDILLALLAMFTIINCGTATDFTHKDGNQKVVLDFENGKKYLEYGKSTKVDFLLKNIKVDDFKVIGVGVRIIGINDGTLKTEIKVAEKERKDNILNVRIEYGENKKEHNFKIPIK